MTEKQDVAAVLAHNIADRRKQCGMTQAELAEKLGYSDKSISKWERCEGMPDVLCLKRMADLFGVPVDALLTENWSPAVPAEEAAEPAAQTEILPKTKLGMGVNHWAIAAVTVSGTWLAALLLFLIGKFCAMDFSVALAAAIPITGLLSVIFNALWGKRKLTFWFCTFFVIGVLFMICWLLREHNIWGLMALTLPAAGVIWFGCRIRG
ncbi:MAG: helix-turn-helix transcriptional regulator [Clostridia bacterium]|nr:helix-turn-helix transcriptional regulator [Clostridia bacterium]